MFEEDRPLPPRQERSIEGSGDKSSIIQQRYRVLNDTMRYVEPQQEPEAINGARKRLARDFLPPWRTEEDLPHSARILYQEAADLATIPLKTLVTATSQMERKLEIWSGKREKERRGEEAENGAGHWKGNGKETEPS